MMKSSKWSLRLLAVGLMALAGLSVSLATPAEAGHSCAHRCQTARNYCTAGCQDLVGAAKGFCLNQCKSEYNSCLSGC